MARFNKCATFYSSEESNAFHKIIDNGDVAKLLEYSVKLNQYYEQVYANEMKELDEQLKQINEKRAHAEHQLEAKKNIIQLNHEYGVDEIAYLRQNKYASEIVKCVENENFGMAKQLIRDVNIAFPNPADQLIVRERAAGSYRYACEYDNDRMVEFLLDNGVPRPAGSFCFDGISTAITDGSEKVLRLLFRKGFQFVPGIEAKWSNNLKMRSEKTLALAYELQNQRVAKQNASTITAQDNALADQISLIALSN